MNNQPENLLLNLGCGSNFHPNWTNLDLVPQSKEVQRADLSKGIPFGDDSAAVVYHSHVLEHLAPNDATSFIRECYRVLMPGGVLRIAVPDLEQIAGHYLETIYRAWQEPSEHSLANHRWMQLEMIDQIARRESGGEMGKFMSDPEIANADFVEERLDTSSLVQPRSNPTIHRTPNRVPRTGLKDSNENSFALFLERNFWRSLIKSDFANRARFINGCTIASACGSC